MTIQVGKALNNETESAPRARSQFHFSSFAFGHKSQSQSNVKCLCSFRSPIEVEVVARRVPGHRIPCDISVHELM